MLCLVYIFRTDFLKEMFSVLISIFQVYIRPPTCISIVFRLSSQCLCHLKEFLKLSIPKIIPQHSTQFFLLTCTCLSAKTDGIHVEW